LIVVMNVVSVKDENKEAFEETFRGRESHVGRAEGFVSFELLRRDVEGEYVVLSRWESEETYKAWRESDMFKKSHRHANGELAFNSRVRNYDVIDTRVPVS
jgi:heme oxygenase (staphylobilin-producing)